MRRWIIRILKVTGGLVFILGLIAAGLFWKFVGFIPTADFSEPTSRAEAQLQDITWLRTYPTLDKSFTAEERERVSGFLDELEARAGEMTDGEFELEIARAVAFADNAHTNLSPISRTRRVDRLPVRFTWMTEGLVITQTISDYRDLLGGIVEGFDTVPTSVAAERMYQTFGGPENRRHLMAALSLNSPALLHAAGITTDPEMTTLHLSRRGAFTLASLSSDPDHSTPWGRTLLEYEVPDHDNGTWVSLMESQSPPLPLQDAGVPFVRKYLEDRDLYYVKLNYNYSVEGWDLVEWLRETADDMRRVAPRYAVMDLRFNGGGTDATAGIAKSLPEILPQDGLVFVVTSAQTFSAGVGAAAEFKLQMGDRARIVGTLVGDRLRFWANGGSAFRLPNSGASVPVWRALEDYGEGCWSVANCFWVSPGFRRKGVDTLEPDIPAQLSLEAYRAGRDPSMEAVYREIAAHESR